MSNSNSIGTKFCKVCQCETERYKDGKCKPCANRRSAKWRIENPIIDPTYHKNWVAENKEKSDLAKRRWYDKNREKKRKNDLRWYNENKDKASAKRARWAKENRDKVNAGWQNRKAKKLAIPGKLSNGLKEKLFSLQRGKCACCGLPLGDNYHLDHIMPLALGGPNTDDNIQLLRQRCNNQKHAKHPVDFMQERGFLL